MGTSVAVAYSDSIAWIKITRPEALNALNVDVLTGLLRVFSELSAECASQRYSKCRAAVICSEGDKAFVAGADIKLMQLADASQIAEFAELGQSVMRAIEACPLAVIAMVQGFAIGGGLELALACDLICASEQAKLGQAEVNLGLIPGFGGTQRLVERCGSGVAKRLVFTAENISAEEALRLGIVDYVVPHGQLLEKTKAIAALIASKSPVAVASAKRAIQSFHAEQKRLGLQAEVNEFVSGFATGDAREGLAAFVEKRKAVFPGN